MHYPTEKIDFKNNCINTIRLLAAIQVLWVHARVHLSLSNPPILGEFIEFFTGVPIFLTLSGFLLWQSIGKTSSFIEYFKKRVLRIYPELWVAVVVEIIVLLVLYDHEINWPQLGLFFIGQSTFFQFWTPDFLRDYGCGSPNGALWTISVLIQFYLFVYIIYKQLHGKRICIWGWVVVVTILLGYLTPFIENLLPSTLGKLYDNSLFPYLWMFMLAAFASEFKEYFLPTLRDYWYVPFLLLIANRYFFHIDLVMNTYYAFFDTLLLFLSMIGFSYRFPQLRISPDISYGVYIYHMTIINAIISLGYTAHQGLFAVVVIMTCVFAWVSTITVGRFSLNKKKYE